MPAVIDGMKLHLGQCRAQRVAVYKGYGHIFATPEKQNGCVQVAKRLIGFQKRVQHSMTQCGQERMFETLELHLDFILRFEIFNPGGIEQIFRGNLQETIAADPPDNCLCHAWKFFRGLKHQRQLNGSGSSRIDQDQLLHAPRVADGKGRSDGSAQGKTDQVHRLGEAQRIQ